MSTPTERVREFIKQRETMRGLDPDDVISANCAPLRLSDLRALVADEEPARPAGVHMLTGAEIAVRDWLREQPGGTEMWMTIKAGFRRSYELGRGDR